MFLAERDDLGFINERNASCPRADSNLEPEDEFGGAAFEEHDAIQDLFLLVDSSSLAKAQSRAHELARQHADDIWGASLWDEIAMEVEPHYGIYDSRTSESPYQYNSQLDNSLTAEALAHLVAKHHAQEVWGPLLDEDDSRCIFTRTRSEEPERNPRTYDTSESSEYVHSPKRRQNVHNTIYPRTHPKPPLKIRVRNARRRKRRESLQYEESPRVEFWQLSARNVSKFIGYGKSARI